MFILRMTVFALFLSGYVSGTKYGYENYGIFSGAFLGFITTFSEQLLKKVNFGTIAGGIIGLATGLLFASLLLFPLKLLFKEDISLVHFALKGVLGYGGLLIGLSRGKRLTVPGLFRLLRGKGFEENLKILDTSVIIDGRVADICDTGFLEGTFIVPQFIL